MSDDLKPYLVYFVYDEDYCDPSVEESRFTCMGDDEDHAREQCHDAYEDVTVLRVVELEENHVK
jgi:hypothetical protein